MIDHENTPDEDRPEHINVAEKVANYLRNDPHLSAKLYDFDNTDLAQGFLYILNNSIFCTASEQLALMRDIRDTEIGKLSAWVEANYLTDNVAGSIWKEATANE
jgi:hypothetical protein